MARPSRASRAAPTATSASMRLDGFGRVSKRVAPSTKKPVLTAEATTTPSRREAMRRFFETKKQEDDAARALPPSLPSQSSFPPLTTSNKPSTAAVAAAVTPAKQRKRRAAEALDADADANADAYASSPSPSQRSTPPKRTCRAAGGSKVSVAELLARAAQKKAAVAATADSDSDSPHTAGDLVVRLNLGSNGSVFPTSSASSCSASAPRSTASSPCPASTAPTTPCESETENEGGEIDVVSSSSIALPAALLDLIALQCAFAKTLALHHVHHGTHAPVDLRTLCPSIAQSWGKRKVTVDDVRRCVGVATVPLPNDAAGTNMTSACHHTLVNALFLADYSRGKICVELRPEALDATAAAAGGNISTLADQLNATFSANLRARWAATGRSATNTARIAAFIETLPKAPVTKCASLLQASATRAKGQRSLEELMRGIALKKQEREARETLLKTPVAAVVAKPESAMDVDARTTTDAAKDGKDAQDSKDAAAPAEPMNLLDRIRFRQLQRAQLQAAGKLAPPLTPEALERRAALQRAGDIAEVLAMLCAAAAQRHSSRVSFGMTAITAKIRDSLRLPIAREEAAACVRLLAREVAPQWLQMVSMGGREIVIMMADRTPSQAAIQSRVQGLAQ